jgi:xylan 1,4-beta-xylosidase
MSNEIRTYNNPVRRGFYPDPSVIRVGEDYYMVNSTFQYFPAVVIAHSRDLVHWETIGHAITSNDYLDLSDIADSHGIWAPDISYHEGIFYIFATLRLNGTGKNGNNVLRRQLVMKSTQPEGPYSKPICLEVDNIDPSHFIDDDGSHYLVVSPGITIAKLNDDCSQVLSAPRNVWSGTGLRAPEGPHLLKKDGYYYAILAEGGTGYGHRVSVARACNLHGPYEACPFNPVLKQNDPDAPIQRAGHGKLIRTQKGDWWLLYLCGRPNQGNFTTIGRETALDPVRWTEDGWFVVNEGRGPSAIQQMPDLPEYQVEEANIDHFDFKLLGLDPQWQFIRNPDNSAWSLTERPGYLRIWTGDGDLNELRAKNTLVRRETEHHYTAITKLEFNPTCPGEQAGLTCYYSTDSYIKFCLINEAVRKLQVRERRRNQPQVVAESDPISEGPVYLRVDVTGQTRRFSYSYDGREWRLVGAISNCTFLSDEGFPEQKKRHTGTMVGLYANNGGCGSRIPADFDWFSYYCPDDRINVFIVGDSTVRNWNPTTPCRWGWGQKLAAYFNSAVTVHNEAVAGCSSKSYISEERLLPIENKIKLGDYLLIQFGHNDHKPNEPRGTEPFAGYKEYLTQYIRIARCKGAFPVLVTPVVRRHFEGDKLLDTHGPYLTAMKELARELKVPLIDLEAKSRCLLETLGETETKQLFFWMQPGESLDFPEGIADNSHFNENGAGKIAALVAEAIRESGVELAKYLI